jgi:hypothetical protein
VITAALSGRRNGYRSGKMETEVRMILRFGLLCSLLAATAAFGGDGISPLGSAAAYPAHVTAGRVTIGAAYVSPATAKKLFGDDLDKRGYVVFEIGMFPSDGEQIDVAADDFKLRQGKDPSITRAATPQRVAADVRPQKTPHPQPKLPGDVTVHGTETIGYETGPYGHGVYTGSRVDVGVGKDPQMPPPPPPPAPTGSQADLQQQLEGQSLPDGKTSKAVAGYIFFPKPSSDKRADFELLYFGQDGQVSLKLSPAVK